MISACKEDKKLPLEESIQIDGNKAPLLGINMTEAPVESDNENYLSAEVNQSVSLTYEGMEKNTITWEIDGETVSTGDQFSINHQWDSPGMKTVKAILSNGEERTAFVLVSDLSQSTTEPINDSSQETEPTPNSAPKKPRVDTDDDGLPDDMDACPNQPGERTNKGCPWPDSDGDNVPDHKDKCPDEAGIAKYNGCNPPAASDKDGDGIEDKKDKCPDTPGVDEYSGCPPPRKDSDGDGIYDNEDACPKDKGTKQYNGCPPPDSDGDGIPDKDDKCPNEKGTKEYNGCTPPKAFAATASGTICTITSLAALDDEKETAQSGFIKIKPTKDMILHEAKLVTSGHGKIDFTLEGDDIKKEINITKNVNPGNSTLRFNDFKSNILRAGKSYTLTYQVQGDVLVTVIRNAFSSGTSNGDVSLSGKNIFYDVVYKY